MSSSLFPPGGLWTTATSRHHLRKPEACVVTIRLSYCYEVDIVDLNYSHHAETRLHFRQTVARSTTGTLHPLLRGASPSYSLLQLTNWTDEEFWSQAIFAMVFKDDKTGASLFAADKCSLHPTSCRCGVTGRVYKDVRNQCPVPTIPCPVSRRLTVRASNKKKQ